MRTPTLPREFYLHKGATPVTREGIDGIVYTHEIGAKPVAMAFAGKQAKPVWHYSFRNTAEREKKIDEFFTNLQGRKEWKAKMFKEVTHSVPHGTTVFCRCQVKAKEN